MILVYCENEGWLKYLADNTVEFHDLPLTWEQGSQVPSWLTGTYVRNGPGQHTFGSESRQMSNWMDGFPKLHSFKFSGEQAGGSIYVFYSYSCKLANVY